MPQSYASVGEISLAPGSTVLHGASGVMASRMLLRDSAALYGDSFASGSLRQRALARQFDSLGARRAPSPDAAAARAAGSLATAEEAAAPPLTAAQLRQRARRVSAGDAPLLLGLGLMLPVVREQREQSGDSAARPAVVISVPGSGRGDDGTNAGSGGGALAAASAALEQQPSTPSMAPAAAAAAGGLQPPRHAWQDNPAFSSSSYQTTPNSSAGNAGGGGGGAVASARATASPSPLSGAAAGAQRSVSTAMPSLGAGVAGQHQLPGTGSSSQAPAQRLGGPDSIAGTGSGGGGGASLDLSVARQRQRASGGPGTAAAPALRPVPSASEGGEPLFDLPQPPEPRETPYLAAARRAALREPPEHEVKPSQRGDCSCWMRGPASASCSHTVRVCGLPVVRVYVCVRQATPGVAGTGSAGGAHSGGGAPGGASSSWEESPMLPIPTFAASGRMPRPLTQVSALWDVRPVCSLLASATPCGKASGVELGGEARPPRAARCPGQRRAAGVWRRQREQRLHAAAHSPHGGQRVGAPPAGLCLRGLAHGVPTHPAPDISTRSDSAHPSVSACHRRLNQMDT